MQYPQTSEPHLNQQSEPTSEPKTMHLLELHSRGTDVGSDAGSDVGSKFGTDYGSWRLGAWSAK